jgi:hypothetical protein
MYVSDRRDSELYDQFAPRMEPSSQWILSAFSFCQDNRNNIARNMARCQAIHDGLFHSGFRSRGRCV